MALLKDLERCLFFLGFGVFCGFLMAVVVFCVLVGFGFIFGLGFVRFFFLFVGFFKIYLELGGVGSHVKNLRPLIMNLPFFLYICISPASFLPLGSTL